ncbi:hypothetical protein [Enterocloster citroniae]|uniref:BppU N-terminal domain-containing protein n=1 Tax=[Clostridium] citroniae WAL-17108 TaxID=742733 RepID=G5HEV0_9FIRM|nr:hypothetical protein [Enterocloster citroniae]EHF00059.1 hypothetical protein HMPREF9469_00973 [ [[Clostridium] citroniae WAL-17108]DAT42546.1 MAG TPA: hypothetical protein [Caudoviricetes sp.]
MILDVQHYKDELKEIQNNTSVTHTTFNSLDQHLIINTKTREIQLPTDFRFLGVENDHAAKTFYFEIDRYYDGTDLSIHTCIVQYICSDGVQIAEGFYPVTEFDLDSVPDKIIFGWTVNNDVTSIPGNVFFAIRFYSITDNSFSYNFNTLEAKTSILDGMDTTKSDLLITPSILSMWEYRMNKLNASITNDIANFEDRMSAQVTVASHFANDSSDAATKSAESAAASAQALADNKAYVESQKDAFVGYNRHETDVKYANALTSSTGGSGHVTVNDAAAAPFVNLNVAGKGEQVRATGAQLMDTSRMARIHNDVVFTVREDGSILVTGNTLQNAANSAVASTNLSPGTYYVSGSVPIDNSKIFVKAKKWYSDGSSVVINDTSFVVDGTETKIDYFIQIYQGLSDFKVVVYPMLNAGPIPLPWEPYTGGKPSPSPEYPQEVIGTGTVTMGMQLLPDSALSTGYLTSADGKKDPNSIYRTIWINLLAGTYTFSVSGGAMIVKTVIDGVFGNNNTAIVDGSGYTCILASDGYLGISFRKLDSTEYTTEPQVMLNIGTRTNPWEPYTGGKPSPSSEYPQPLAITVTGAQLINPDSRNASRAICTVINDKIKIVAVDDTGWQNIHFRIGPAEKYAGKKLYLHITNMSGGTDTARAMLVWTKDNIGAVTSFFTYGKSQFGTWKEIDIPSSIPDSADTLSLYLCITEYKNDNSYPVIGTEAVFERVILSESKVDWRPYQSNTATIQLTSPLYAVEDHKDEITMTKRINRCVELEFNGSEDWGLYDSTVYKGFWLYNALPEKMNRREGFCNQLKIDTIGRKTENGLWLGPNSGNKAIYAINSQFFDDTAADKGLAAWKAHLASHPLKIVTYLDTPVETDLPAATQSALNALTTFTGTTHITITAGGAEPDVAVEYVQDTQTALENIQKNAVTPEQISEAVETYMEKNPEITLPDDILPRITALENQIADLLYKAISITSFTTNVTTAELGSTVNSLTLKWTTNKVPKSLILDSEVINTSLSQKVLTNAGITSDKTYRLTATDERNASASKTASIAFLNGCYYGVSSDVSDAAINNQLILSFTKVLSNSKARTITVNPGTDEYIYYAIPARLGTPVFKVSGFEGGFSLAKTLSFTNASGYTENYNVYRSTNKGLGNTTIDIS